MPTPPRPAAKDLAPGRSYLHTNGLFVRHIDAIEGGTVLYQPVRPGPLQQSGIP
jgi:hypothetical protein